MVPHTETHFVIGITGRRRDTGFSSGRNSFGLVKRVVEAGGVEPPSEKPCNAKTTCLARSDFFVASAQSGQDALATSPMISPPHYGPKRGDQPTV